MKFKVCGSYDMVILKLLERTGGILWNIFHIPYLDVKMKILDFKRLLIHLTFF